MPGFDPESYVADYVEVLRSLDQAAVDCMAQTIFGAWRARRTVFCCGNGGSASSASHFVMDLAKLTAPRRGPRLRTIALTDSLAAISAIANDIAYEEVFAEQLRSLLEPRDVVIGFSTSGSSPNVLRAIDYANAAGATTIGVTGRGGTALGRLAHRTLFVDSVSVQHVEDATMVVAHLLCLHVKELIEETSSGAVDRASAAPIAAFGGATPGLQ